MGDCCHAFACCKASNDIAEEAVGVVKFQKGRCSATFIKINIEVEEGSNFIII